MSRYLVEMLREVPACPLCGDARSDARAAPEPNLYSEQIALLLGCGEEELLATVCNHRCTRCGLWYKRHWFTSAQLGALFSERVPDHPKGWDAVSNRFSAQGYEAAVHDLRGTLASGDSLGCARARRALGSIIDSLQEADGDTLRAPLQQAVAAGDTVALTEAAPTLAPRFAEPAPFKRFSGFSSRLLWEWMESHIGPVGRYGEVGCPLWGQLSRPADDSVQRWYFARPEPNYWGSGCRRGGQHCSARLAEASGVALSEWPPSGEPLDALGALQYLDHLKSPGAFAAEVFAHARALLLVLDAGETPTAIQHATGWDERPIAWLAERHGKRVVDNFAPMAGSGNDAWLLCDG